MNLPERWWEMTIYGPYATRHWQEAHVEWCISTAIVNEQVESYDQVIRYVSNMSLEFAKNDVGSKATSTGRAHEIVSCDRPDFLTAVNWFVETNLTQLLPFDLIRVVLTDQPGVVLAGSMVVVVRPVFIQALDVVGDVAILE